MFSLRLWLVITLLSASCAEVLLRKCLLYATVSCDVGDMDMMSLCNDCLSSIWPGSDVNVSAVGGLSTACDPRSNTVRRSVLVTVRAHACDLPTNVAAGCPLLGVVGVDAYVVTSEQWMEGEAWRASHQYTGTSAGAWAVAGTLSICGLAAVSFAMMQQLRSIAAVQQVSKERISSLVRLSESQQGAAAEGGDEEELERVEIAPDELP